MNADNLNALSLKIEAASSVIDLVLTLRSTGDIEGLMPHTLYNSLSIALDLLTEVQEIIARGDA